MKKLTLIIMLIYSGFVIASEYNLSTKNATAAIYGFTDNQPDTLRVKFGGEAAERFFLKLLEIKENNPTLVADTGLMVIKEKPPVRAKRILKYPDTGLKNRSSVTCFELNIAAPKTGKYWCFTDAAYDPDFDMHLKE